MSIFFIRRSVPEFSCQVCDSLLSIVYIISMFFKSLHRKTAVQNFCKLYFFSVLKTVFIVVHKMRKNIHVTKNRFLSIFTPQLTFLKLFAAFILRYERQRFDKLILQVLWYSTPQNMTNVRCFISLIAFLQCLSTATQSNSQRFNVTNV